MSATNPMAPAEPVKLKIAPRICEKCGGKYIPTSNRQKYCQECQHKKNNPITEAYAAYQKAKSPGEVVTYKTETPEKKMRMPETPEDPVIPDGIQHGCSDLLKAIEKPDWEAFCDEAHAILIAYGRGDLVDKKELVAEIREKFKSFLEV